MVQASDGADNVTEHCLGRHAQTNAQKAAIVWQSENDDEQRTITYGELSDEMNRLANGLKALGVNSGDAITLFMPAVPEIVIAMLACTRIGAIHSTPDKNLSANELANHIEQQQSLIVITANSDDNGKNNFKDQIDKACNQLEKTNHVHHVIVLDLDPDTAHARDIDFYELASAQSDFCEAESRCDRQTCGPAAQNHQIYRALLNNKTIQIQNGEITIH
ncbi:MAG: hypothetical protein AseanaTS_08820 [Candidatus Pelagadaptatus aseana]|uniref:AMP-binding protein n=1 Tax=Candidatus Pelagadaptatus aseana TaxID=3120508 RepID=UPI0039B173AC